jgi:glycosyltransferase involved in cell wall biosynthesis
VSLRFHIDHPADFSLPNGCLRLRGWAFHPGVPLRKVRFVVGGVVLNGIYGTARPDVAAADPAANGIDPGFEVSGRIAPGNEVGHLEFEDISGTWHRAASYQVRISRWSKLTWIIPGGDPEELLAFQLATQASHAPVPVDSEKFPRIHENGKSLPRISVVTPSFQQGRFLGETINSVLNQTGAPLEYVIEDGGSRDGSVDLIRSHAARLKAWQAAPDDGQSGAIIRGFQKTSGGSDDLMAWINSDDFYLPGSLAYVAGFFARNPSVDVLYGNRILVDENSREVGRWFLPRHEPDVLRLYDFVPQETVFWRRRIWEKVGGLDSSFKFAMDWDLLLRFQNAGATMVRTPYFLACFRLHADQKTAAQIKTTGQEEIDRLRFRTFGRKLTTTEIGHDPRLLSYLRQSAWLEFANRLGYRGPAG